MKTICPSCKEEYDVEESCKNQKAKCGKCGNVFLIKDKKKAIENRNIFITVFLLCIFASFIALFSIYIMKKQYNSDNTDYSEMASRIGRSMTEEAIKRYKEDHNGTLPKPEALSEYEVALYYNLNKLCYAYDELLIQKAQIKEYSEKKLSDLETITFNKELKELKNKEKEYKEALNNILTKGIVCDNKKAVLFDLVINCDKCKNLKFKEDYIKFDYKKDRVLTQKMEMVFYKIYDFKEKIMNLEKEHKEIEERTKNIIERDKTLF